MWLSSAVLRGARGFSVPDEADAGTLAPPAFSLPFFTEGERFFASAFAPSPAPVLPG